MVRKVASRDMILQGAIQLKKGPSRFLKTGTPWVYSNELSKIDTKLPPGSWVALETAGGESLGYGHFNPHSLIAFRLFERAKFRSEEQTRALFYKRLDWAWQLRQKAYGADIHTGEMGAHSFRLAFGESDGVPGLIIDLYEKAGVLQCHSAGADQFIAWAQQWLDQRMGIDAGVIRNDVEVRRREQVELYTLEWGNLSGETHALEGGVRFMVDLRKGQKTGYFYDHRDNRAHFARQVGAMQEAPAVLDCFSYVGGWGLQALKKHPKARLTTVDISQPALDQLMRNAEANGLKARVETVAMDFFKDKTRLASQKFHAVVSDPPALTSSAKQVHQGKRAHESCFERALSHLEPQGLVVFASCSFHLSWDDFMECVSRACHKEGRTVQLNSFGSQAADHPVLSQMPETRYLKCVSGYDQRLL